MYMIKPIYSKNIAKLIISNLRFIGDLYTPENLMEKLKIERKQFYDTLEILITRKQVELRGVNQILVKTEKSEQVFENIFMRSIRTVTSNSTFAACIGAAIGVNIDKPIKWMAMLVHF